MATMNISLPDSMREWVESQLATGLYANNSDYVRDLIRKDQLYSGKLAALQHAITEGVESADTGVLDMRVIKQKASSKVELKAE